MMRSRLIVASLSLALMAVGCAQHESSIHRVQILNLDGNEVPVGTECLAERHLADGRILIYRNTPGDIDALVESLNEDSRSENWPELLDHSFWEEAAKKECKLMAASKCKDGSCSPGKSCKRFFSTSGAAYCLCAK